MSNISLSKVPQTVATDPSCIPLVGCSTAANVSFIVEEKSKYNEYTGDMIIFCVGAQPEKTGGSITEKSRIITLSDEAKFFDETYCEGALQDVINCLEFKGKLGRSVSTRGHSKNSKVKVISALGVGNINDLKSQSCIKIGVEIANLIKANRSASVAIVLNHLFANSTNKTHFNQRQVQCILESVLLELNPDNRFKSSDETRTNPAPIKKVVIYANDVHTVQAAMNTAKLSSKAIYFAIELVNSPANYCNTCSLANAAVEMAQKFGLAAKVLDLPEIEKLNMGCYLGVAKGSLFPPKFIHLTYVGEGKVNSKIALVGKGLCFDSGGYNAKSAASLIELMKLDMGGAAAVFGAAMAIGSIKPKNVEVHFIVAAAENMICEKAYRPGDILTASNGKTVEVGNTDAEGRLTLADALVYAEKLGVDMIVDIATLTGACMVALGDKTAGVFSPSEQVAQEILSCAESCGESMWQLPMTMEYRELFDSKIADMNNIGGAGKGGSIIAALFLKEFVEKTLWCHIDIAGPAWNYKDGRATGFGVKTLTELVLKKSS